MLTRTRLMFVRCAVRRQPGPGGTAAAGFTLLELLFTMAIIGILMTLGIPGFQTWIVNTSVRTSADAMQNSLRLAQAEAIKRNTSIDFIMTASAASASTSASGVTATTSAPWGPNWIVQVHSGSNASSNFIQGFTATGNQKSMSYTPSAAFQGTATYNSLGKLTTPGDFSINITKANATVTLRVEVSAGGSIQVCNPGLPAGDPQGCS